MISSYFYLRFFLLFRLPSNHSEVISIDAPVAVGSVGAEVAAPEASSSSWDSPEKLAKKHIDVFADTSGFASDPFGNRQACL